MNRYRYALCGTRSIASAHAVTGVAAHALKVPCKAACRWRDKCSAPCTNGQSNFEQQKRTRRWRIRNDGGQSARRFIIRKFPRGDAFEYWCWKSLSSIRQSKRLTRQARPSTESGVGSTSGCSAARAGGKRHSPVSVGTKTGNIAAAVAIKICYDNATRS